MEKKRIYKYDNLKFLLIILVIVGHMIDFFNGYNQYDDLFMIRTFIYSVHMPAFIFLSGLFYKEKDTAVKAFQFFSIGILMHVANSLSLIPFGYAFKPNILTVPGVPWYMYAMAFFYIIMYLLRSVNKKQLLVISSILSLLIGCTAQLGDFLSLTRVIVFFPVFLLGTLTDRDKLVKTTDKLWLKLPALAVIAGWAALIITKFNNIKKLAPLFSGKNAYEKLSGGLSVYGIPLRMLVFFIAFVFCFSLLCLVPNKKIPLITVFGSRTLQVYFWHSPVIFIIIQTGLAAEMTTSIKRRLVYLALGIVIAFVLSLKPFGFPTNQIIKHSKSPESKGEVR